MPKLPDGRISYELRHPWSDGTTAVVFEPLTFIERLAALVPPPRAHQVTYHGVLAPAAALRSRIVPGPATSRRRCAVVGSPGVTRRYPWADLLRRVFAVDVLRCQKCGGLYIPNTRPGLLQVLFDASPHCRALGQHERNTLRR